ncbi:MAG TPA: 50S ribosomal protein L25, partial [Pirellulales bacterium]
PVELKGEAPGAASGVVEQHIYKVEIRVSIAKMPEKLFLNVGSLAIGGHLTASQITLPEGGELLTDADAVIVECHERKDVDVDTTQALPSEPEVIKREKKEEDAE